MHYIIKKYTYPHFISKQIKLKKKSGNALYYELKENRLYN